MGFEAKIPVVAEHFSDRPTDNIAAAGAQRPFVRLVCEAITLVTINIGDEHRNVVGINANSALTVAQRLQRLDRLGYVRTNEDETPGRHWVGLELEYPPVGSPPLAGVRLCPQLGVILPGEQHGQIYRGVCSRPLSTPHHELAWRAHLH